MVTRLSADCQAHICMYIIINERESEEERERERKRESEREREKEKEKERERRERPNTTSHLDGESLTTRQKSAKKITRQFSRVLTPPPPPRPQLSRFFTGISRRRYVCGTTSLMFIMGNLFPPQGINEWEFPAKIKKSLPPITSFKMVSKIPGLIYSCRRSYVINL